MKTVLQQRKLTKHRKLSKTIQERYIRPSVPCSFSCCPSPHKYPTLSNSNLNLNSNSLNLSLNFNENPKIFPLIVIPTLDVLQNFLPLFQSNLFHTILLQSVLNEINLNSQSYYRRVIESLKDVFVFCNDIFLDTYVQCEEVKELFGNEKMMRNSDNENFTVNLTEKTKNLFDFVNDFSKYNETDFSTIHEYQKFQKVIQFYSSHIPNTNILILTKTNIAHFPFIFTKPSLISDLLVLSEKEKTEYTEYYNSSKLQCMLQEGSVVKGILYTNSFNCFSGIVHGEIKGKSVKICVNGRVCMNRAMNMDGVYVELLSTKEFFDSEYYIDSEYYRDKIIKIKEIPCINQSENNKNTNKNFENDFLRNKPENVDQKSDLQTDTNIYGKIVGLFKRDYKPLISTIDKNSIHGDGPQYVSVIPLDKKLPKIRIRTSQVDELEGKRILVRVNEWKKDSFYPSGSYIRVIGSVGDRKSEIESILLGNGIDYQNYDETYGLKEVINNLKKNIELGEFYKRKYIDNNEKIKKIKNMNHLTEPNTEISDLKEKSTNLSLNLTEKSLEDKNENLLNELEDVYKEVVQSELKKRTDLRSTLVCSIDPPGCTDIDDALHCTKKQNGNVEVGVHIADVSFFVTPSSLLDIESCKRGTSVYLTDRRIDMLPNYLSSNLCSLVQDKDRLSFSVFWEFDSNFNILSKRFEKTVIRSKRSFTYEEAQNEIEKYKNHRNIKNKEYCLGESIFLLDEIAKKLRKKRFEKGALELNSTEVKIHFTDKNKDNTNTKDKDKETFSFFPKVNKIENKKIFSTNHLVEEFMLLANITVAEEIYSRFSNSAMLRKHPKFSDDAFDDLSLYLSTKNIEFESLTSKDLNRSINSIENGRLREMIKKIVTRSMNQAVYFSSGTCPYEEYLHYGLAIPIYTHFTSPIRRYADIIVHRQLFTCIEENKNGNNDSKNTELDLSKKKFKMSSNEIEDICRNINMRNRCAMYASMECDKLFIYLYLKNKGKSVYDGFVIRIRRNGVVVCVPELGIEDVVKIMDKEYDDERNCFLDSEGNVIHKMYDSLKIEIVENDEMFFINRHFDMKIIN